MNSPSQNCFSSSPLPLEHSSDKISPLVPQTPSQRPSITQIIEEKFAAFSPQSIVEPFEEERQRDIAFQKQLTKMIIDLMLQCHAWSSARPRQERNLAAAKLEKNINTVLKVEQEQGRSPELLSYSILFLVERTRERFGEFVMRMKNALAALTGIGI